MRVWIVVLVCILLCGCVPFFNRLYNECATKTGEILEKDERLPEDTRELGLLLRREGEKVCEKAGPSGEIVTETNVREKFKQAGRAAEDYVPWYKRFPSSGNGALDSLIVIAVALVGGIVEKKWAPGRKLLHGVSHAPQKEGGKV